MESKIIVIDSEELGNIFNTYFENFLKKLAPTVNKPDLPERFNIEEALFFLKKEYGLDVTKSQLYKENHLKRINTEKYGKQIIFTQASLKEWADSKLKYSPDARKTMSGRLASEAIKKGGRA